jgi:hypothetical protein
MCDALLVLAVLPCAVQDATKPTQMRPWLAFDLLKKDAGSRGSCPAMSWGFLSSRQCGRPTEIVMGAQAFHKKNATKNAGDENQYFGEKYFTKQRHVMLRHAAYNI